MTNGHPHFHRFVAPARMINHRRTPPVSSSVASAVRTQDRPPLGPGVVRSLNADTQSRMAQSPRDWQVCRQPTSELGGQLLSVNKVASPASMTPPPKPVPTIACDRRVPAARRPKMHLVGIKRSRVAVVVIDDEPNWVPEGLVGYERPDRMHIGLDPEVLRFDFNINGVADPRTVERVGMGVNLGPGDLPA
jgi:hypothetical protein